MNEELKAIVQRMIDAGEPEENIKLVIQSYSKEPGKTTDPASSSMDSGSENGSSESQGLAKLNLEDYSTKSEDYEDVFVGFLKAIPVLATDSEQRAKAVQFMKNRVDNVPEALKSWIKSSAQVYADTYKRGYLSEDSILSKLIGDEKVKTASEGVDDYIIQKYKEIGELEFKDTGKGMVVGAKEGDAASVVAGVFGAGISMAETVIPAAATGGISLFPMIAAPMYTEYNKSKAKALYGEGKTQLTLEEEQSALEKLVENEQAEIAVPLALGSIATGLEYIGFKGITKYISASPMKGKFLANLLWTGSREGFTEVGQLGVETLNEGLGAQKPIKEASIEAWNTMNSDKGLEMWLNGFLGSTQISVGGRALNRALRSDNASVKELNSKINNLADLNSKKYNTKNNDVKEALEKEIKVAEKDIKDYINKKRKISEILNEDQKESLINIINEKDNITSKIESLKKQLEGGVISNKEFGYAARSLNNQDKRLTEQIEAINETAKQQLLVTGLEATKEEGETVGLKQEVFETKEQYASLFGKKGSKKYNEALKADGHISDDGSTYYVNMDTAREAGAIGVGSHELLHGIIGKSFSKLEPEAQRKLNENFLNLLSKRDKETVLNRLAGAYGITGDKVFTTEELYTAFSDEIVDGGVKFNEGMFGKIKNAYEEILRQLSSAGYFSEDGKTKFLYRKEFGNARQAYNFVKDYSLTIKKTGKLTQRAKEFAKVDPGSEGNLASKTITDAVDKLGKVDKDGNNLTEKGTGNFYYQAEADDVVKEIKEKGYLDNLIAARYKADKVPKNFVSDVITALTPDIKAFKPEENNSLFGYLQGRITFRAGDVYNKIYKQKEEDKGSRDVGETTKEGDVKIQVAAETTSEMKQLEEKDMSIQAQIQEKADKQKTKQQAESKFRKILGLETGGVLYMKVLDAARKSLLRAYSTKDTVRQIQRNLRDQANTYLFKDVKNLLGTNKYEANLKQYREIIMESLFVSDLVQMERETPQDDRVFTKFVKKLTTKQEVEDAVNQNLLPPSAINAYNKDKSVNLYQKGNPTEKQFLSYFMIPAINPITGLRSGKKGTRKDTLAKNMAGALSYDATMEVAQEKEVAEKREQLSEVRGEDIGSLERLAEAINRDMDVKFSKTINSSKVPKISQYLKYQENKLGVNHPGFEFIYTIRQSVEEGLDLKTAYDNAKAALPSQSPILDLIINDGNLNNLHIDNIVYGVNNFVLGKIRKLGHDSSVKYLKNKLKKATTNKQKVAIVNEYLKNIGRSVRSSMVDGITTNEKLKDEVIVPLGLGEFYTLADAQPKGKKLMFRESKNGEFKAVELYENIEAIKNDPDGKRNKVNEQAEEARKYIEEILDSNLDTSEKKAIVQLMAYDQRGALRKSSKLGMNTVGLKSSETIMEHEFTVKDLVDKLNDYIDGKDVNLEELFNKGKVHVLPKQLDRILRDEKISQRGDNRYENQKFKQKLNEYISDGVVVNAKFSKSQDFTKANNATSFSRSTNNPAKGITVLDFDDTLATTKSLVKFTRPDGTTGTLNAEQYASTYENLLDQGYTFDFSEFNKVVKGKLAPLFNKAMKLQSKFGPKNMFVLTARPPAAQKAIFDFLKANGLNIPIDNITGLGNSTAEAKALWIADKVGEGYNDFYFADDALQNVQAVDNMLKQFDVKSKVQQARVKFSKTMDDKFNDILEDVTGIETQKRFSAIKGRKRGDDKGKFRFFIPPSHEDFVGLLYNFMGEGRKGDAHRNFLEQALVRPLNRAYRELDTAKQAIANDYKKLNEQFPDVNDKLIKTTPDGDFTFQDAIRVYLWNKHGHKIPGLTETDQAKLTKLVESDSRLQAYAETLNVISKQEDYVAPGESWETANIRIDLVDATGRVGRAQYLSEFIENADVLFSEENLNKIEAAYGKDFREALEDMLHRIKTGVNRPKGQSGKPNRFLNWLNASVAGVMFFNTRSALLQQLSNVNYLNFADNNILAAGKAFANQKQYWKDFAFILNSDMLKQRRGGIGTDVNGAELVEAIKKARPDSLFDQVAIITGKLLRLGFLPTQIGDSIAIATGGAAFYRNRVNTYLKQGLSQKEAEAKAFTDFQDITQSTQQSARPDMTSQQQASWIGKLVLNFLNTPSQYNRIIKKAGSDLKNRRITKPNTTQTQSDMSNLSRILYYGAAQNLIFYGLQTALFAVMFGGDDDDESEAFLKKKERVINGSIDTILRGSGIYGVALSTLKNMLIKFAEQREKGYNKDESAVIMEALNFSPVLGIRARKIVNAEKTLNYNAKVIDEMTTFDIDNPQWSAVTNYVEGTTTLPVNRLYQKTINVRNALDNQYTAFQRAMFFSGYTTWSLDLGDTEKMKKIKEKVKSKKKSKGRKTFKRKTLTR